MSIDKEAFKAGFAGLTIPELGFALAEKKKQLDEAKSKAAGLQDEYDALRIELIPAKMEEFGTTSMKISGLGRLTISADAYVSTVKGMKPVLLDWLKKNDFNELLKEDINPSTLKAWYKEQLGKGNEVPPEEIINFLPFDRASITKA